MFRAHFTSTSKVSLLEVVLDFLDDAKALGARDTIIIDMMVFSFTSQGIYDQIIALSKQENIKFRILADWGNISLDNERKVALLAQLRSSEIEIKYKFDQPYYWDLERDKLQWSYHTSLGMLHHKTILVSVNEKPTRLLTGSFNWTKKAVHNYENILEVEADSKQTSAMLNAFNAEFLSLWNNPALSLTPGQAKTFLLSVEQFYRTDKTRRPEQFLETFTSQQSLEDERKLPTNRTSLTFDALVAFSGSHPYKQWRNLGFAAQNAWRYFEMNKVSAPEKRVPLSLTTAALDVIFRADKSSQLCLCMYAISQRVPEYNALLNAAREGVAIKMILDQEANQFVMEQLKEKINQEGLPIQIKAGKRGMHQKYLLDSAKFNLVTGTANMSTDASNRHAEHRFLFRNNVELARSFTHDFETIWSRLSFQ